MNIIDILPEIRSKIFELFDDLSFVRIMKVCKNARKIVNTISSLEFRYKELVESYKTIMKIVMKSSYDIYIPVRICSRFKLSRSQILEILHDDYIDIYLTENTKVCTYHFCYYSKYNKAIVSINSILMLINRDFSMKNVFADDYTHTLKYYTEYLDKPTHTD